MHPHCSLYGYQAFQQYDPLIAFLKTADRLHRCGHDLDNYAAVEVSGLVKFLDPVRPSGLHDDGSDPKADGWHAAGGPISLSAAASTGMLSADSSHGNLDEDGRLFHFAQTLETEGDYDRAGVEYRRLASYFPGSPYVYQALRSVFYCYYRAGEYLKAVNWGQDLLGHGLQAPDESELKFYIGASYFKLANFRLAESYLTEVASSDASVLREKSLLLKGLSHAHESEWDEAEKAFASIPSSSGFSDNAKQCRDLTQGATKLRMRNSTIAGVLALVPGLGYLYDGYKQTALSSFVVNGLFFWGTAQSFQRDNQSLGAMLAVLSFGWYAGNIYGSVVSAQRRNVRVRDEFLREFDVGFRF